MNPKQTLGMGLRTSQRLALLGRLRMAEWIEMPEREFAQSIAEIEKDPLFKKLFFGSIPGQNVIRRQGWPRGRLSGSFYEVDEGRAAGGEKVQVEAKLDTRAALVPKIQAMGQSAFERYFLQADEALPMQEIARRTGMSLADVEEINDLLLEIGSEEEFSPGVRDPGLSAAYACLAQVSIDDDGPKYEFFSPHWARGLYQIRYDLLERIKDAGQLTGPERKRLRHLLKRMELINLRQNTLFRVLETVTKLNVEYLRTRQEDRKRPISLRMLAHRLDLAPSTVSRALSHRSVRLPWGKEVPLHSLVPGRRNVLREVISLWTDEASLSSTDAQLRDRLRKEYGIQVSRRTVNAVRNEVLKARPR